MTENPDQHQPAPEPIDYTGVDKADPSTWNVGHDTAEEVVRPEDLKGQALDQALTDAGLPHTGTADEKRERLAENEQQ